MKLIIYENETGRVLHPLKSKKVLKKVIPYAEVGYMLIKEVPDIPAKVIITAHDPENNTLVIRVSFGNIHW